jgi:DNA-directed RNA polymerase specialized sigma24 family protein
MELEHYSLADLIAVCRCHTERFQRGAPSDARFCLELWRRALDAHDPEAWQGLDTLYRPLLAAKLRQRQAGLDDDTIQEVLQRTFIHLWHKSLMGAFSTTACTLPQVLTYVWNAVLQAVLALHRQRQHLPLPESGAELVLPGLGQSGILETQLELQEWLSQLRAAVTDLEWRVLVLRHAYGLAIPAIAAQLGLTETEVYRVLARVLRRLRHSPALRAAMHDAPDADDQAVQERTVC